MNEPAPHLRLRLHTPIEKLFVPYWEAAFKRTVDYTTRFIHQPCAQTASRVKDQQRCVQSRITFDQLEKAIQPKYAHYRASKIQETLDN
jgi:hypothetical protein